MSNGDNDKDSVDIVKLQTVMGGLQIHSDLPEFQKNREPMLERHSHAFGLVEMFPPHAPVEKWDTLPWVIKVERYDHDGRKKFKIKPEHVMDAYNSPGLIESHRYVYKDEEEKDAL